MKMLLKLSHIYWRSLYENWLNYYVYQNTPYDLGAMERVKHEK